MLSNRCRKGILKEGDNAQSAIKGRKEKKVKQVLPTFRVEGWIIKFVTTRIWVDDGLEFVLKLWCRKMRRYQRHR